MKIEVEAVEELLNKSRSDIFPEDYLSEIDVEEGSEEEEFIYENFTAINNYVIQRLKTRLAFMKQGLSEQFRNRRKQRRKSNEDCIK